MESVSVGLCVPVPLLIERLEKSLLPSTQERMLYGFATFRSAAQLGQNPQPDRIVDLLFLVERVHVCGDLGHELLRICTVEFNPLDAYAKSLEVDAFFHDRNHELALPDRQSDLLIDIG